MVHHSGLNAGISVEILAGTGRLQITGIWDSGLTATKKTYLLKLCGADQHFYTMVPRIFIHSLKRTEEKKFN